MKTTIEMAQSVGAGRPSSLYGRTDYVVFTKSELGSFAELVRADEREQCARVCDDLPAPDSCSNAKKNHWDVATLACGDAIRARSNT